MAQNMSYVFLRMPLVEGSCALHSKKELHNDLISNRLHLNHFSYTLWQKVRDIINLRELLILNLLKESDYFLFDFTQR